MISSPLQTIIPNNKQAAVLLHFSNSTVQVSSFIFINALFLSSYPTSWLVYFFIGQTIVDIAVSYLFAPLLRKNSHRGLSLVVAASAAVMTLFCILHYSFSFYYLPLVFSFFMMSAGLITNVISWASVRTAFDVIEFKNISTFITMANSVSSIITSVIFFILINRFSVNFIPYVMIVLLLISSGCCYLLKPLPAKKKSMDNIPLHYALYKKVFFIIFLIALSYTLVDYCFKFHISTTLNEKQIGQFMAIFNGLSNTISLLCSLVGIKFLINHFGATSLLTTLPIYWLTTGIIAILFPGFTTATLFAAGKYIFYYSIFSTGRELVLNVLPNVIRTPGQILIKTVATPAAAGVASLFLFLFADKLSLSFIIFLVVLINIGLLIYARNIRFTYLATIKDSIYLKRFDREQENIVSGYTMEAVSVLSKQTLLPIMIERILQGGVFFQAQKIMTYLGNEAIPILIQTIEQQKSQTRVNLKLLIAMLASIPGKDAESHLLILTQDYNVIVKTIAAKELAYRVRTIPLPKYKKKIVREYIKKEYSLFLLFLSLQHDYQHQHELVREINSRIALLKQRFLHWLVIYTDSQEIAGSIPILLGHYEVDRAKALELITDLLNEPEMTQIIISLFYKHAEHPYDKSIQPAKSHNDDWLEKIILFSSSHEAGNIMNAMQKVFELRAIELFKQLPGETLLIIADLVEVIKKTAHETVFLEGDPPSGLYIIVSGTIEIRKKDHVLNTLKQHDFFGELALLDNAPRTASAIAATDSVLLFLDVETFNRLTEDQPDVLRAVVNVVLRYLRSYLDK